MSTLQGDLWFDMPNKVFRNYWIAGILSLMYTSHWRQKTPQRYIELFMVYLRVKGNYFYCEISSCFKVTSVPVNAEKPLEVPLLVLYSVKPALVWWLSQCLKVVTPFASPFRQTKYMVLLILGLLSRWLIGIIWSLSLITAASVSNYTIAVIPGYT